MSFIRNPALAVFVTFVYIYVCRSANGTNLRIVGVLDTDRTNVVHLDSYVTEINSVLQTKMTDMDNMTITMEVLIVNDTDNIVNHVLTRIGNTSDVLAIFSGLEHDSLLVGQLLIHPSIEGIPLLDPHPNADRIERYTSLVSVNVPVDDVTSALVHLLTHLRWSYVQAVYLNTSYFSDILEHVHTVAGRANICVLKSFSINYNITETQILNTIQSLERESNTTGILLLMDTSLTNRFIDFIKRRNISTQFHLITLGNWYETRDTPMLGTLALSREWNRTNIAVSERNSTLKVPSLDTTLHFLLGGLDLAKHDITNCLATNTTAFHNICIRRSLLRKFREDMRNISVYNYQRDENATTWIKTMTFGGDKPEIQFPIVFYTKDEEPFDGFVVSTSQPWRWECRHYIIDNFYASPRADVYLLAVLPVHDAGDTPSGCGDLNPDQVILTEAVSYGVDLINNNTELLSGLSLGYILIDSCSIADRTMYLLDQMYSAKGWKGISFLLASQVFGAVGFTRYNEYTPLAGYFNSKDLLTISATTSNSDLSNKEMYPSFIRMVPDQKEEIRVMFQVLKFLEVKYICIVYSDIPPNDVIAITAIDVAKTFNISVIYSVRITEDASQNDSDMNYLVETFISRNLNSTTVLMTFADAKQLLPLLKALQRQYVEKVMWIGGSSWFSTLHYDDLLPYANLLRRAFVVEIASYPVPSFTHHLTQVQSSNNTKSVYMDELFNLMLFCQKQTDKDEPDICHKLHSDLYVHNDAFRIIDSIKALAVGLDEVIQKRCHLGDFCSDAKNNLAGQLQDNIFQYHFLGSSGKNVRFDSKGNGPASFEIYRVVFDEHQASNGYQKVGTFEDGSLSISSDISASSLNIRKSDCSSNACAHVPPEIFGKPYVYIEGDPMLYGFVKLYRHDNNDTCSWHVNSNGYQVMESMIWAVSLINNNSTLLPNVKLGLAVFPTCGVPTKTENIVKSVLLPNVVLPKKGLRQNTTILGVVGGEEVLEAISVEKATRAVNSEIPVIISSRADVNDGNSHPRLFRTVLSPFAEMNYILELCMQLKWTYIHVVYSPLMENVVRYLGDISKGNGICIASRNMLKLSASPEFTRSTLVNMTEVEGATAVILAVPPKMAKQVLEEARLLHLLGKLFFVLPFEDYDMENYLSEQDIGVLSTRKDIQINEQFMNYFLNLNIKNKTNNLWFAEFWQQANICNLRSSNRYAKDCSNSESLTRSNVIPSPSINGIVDSVFSLGHALHGLLRKCKAVPHDCIKGDRSIFYNTVTRYLSEISFTAPGGTPFKFQDKSSASTALIVMNVQKSPEGGIRLVDVGRFESGRLTLDMRKLSFYRNGLRVIPDSKCLGDCRNCLDPDFVNEYDTKVTSLRSTGPILKHKFFTALGVIDIILIFISFMFITIASYFLCKFYRHKVFNICSDADAGILIGCSFMTCSSCCHLFTQTKLMCTIQIAAPALAYAISIASLIVKINKTVCLRTYLGLQQSSVPRWDFALTYIPLLLVPTIIAFLKWMQSDVIIINSTVPGIREISNIDEVNITWRCTFDREVYSVYMTTFWFVIIEVFVITLSYKLRGKKEPEVNQVTWSSTISLVFIATCTLVLMLTGNVEIYDIVMCFTLNINSMALVCANFLPPVLLLMTEEQREEQFMNIMTQDRVKRMATYWREHKSKKRRDKESIEDGSGRHEQNERAASLWNKGRELATFGEA